MPLCNTCKSKSHFRLKLYTDVRYDSPSNQSKEAHALNAERLKQAHESLAKSKERQRVDPKWRPVDLGQQQYSTGEIWSQEEEEVLERAEISKHVIASNGELGSVRDIIARSTSCDFCRILAHRLKQENANPKDTCELLTGLYCIIRPTKKSIRIVHHLQVTLIPPTSTPFTGPLLPYQNDLAAERSRIILSLQPFSKAPLQVPVVGSMGDLQNVWSTSGYGRRVDPNQVNMNLLSTWKNRCRDSHGDKCSQSFWPQSLPSALQSLLLVDVQRMCIVEAPPDCTYVALSYCWGTTKTLTHVLANSDELFREGSLISAHLPTTISDAIRLVDAIGERYLWVDALCIVQDDFSSKDIHLSQMGLVYSSAVLTVVAAAGSDSSSGLPGVGSVPRTSQQEIIEVGDGDENFITELFRGDQASVAGSTWMTRAWTLQEKVLSRRLMIFTAEQVYWSCSSALWIEGTELESAARYGFPRHPVSSSWIGLDLKNAQSDYHSVYQKLVNEYMERNLTYPSDTLNAFSGILQLLSAANNAKFYWGIPESKFDLYLCWDIQGGCERNLATYRNGSGVQAGFPSWNWAGWFGGPIGLFSWHVLDEPDPPISDIVKYRLDDEGGLRTIGDETANRLGSEPEWIESRREITHDDLVNSDRINMKDAGHLYFWTSTATLLIHGVWDLHRQSYKYQVVTDGVETGSINLQSRKDHNPIVSPETDSGTRIQKLHSRTRKFATMILSHLHSKKQPEEDMLATNSQGQEPFLLEREFIVIGRASPRNLSMLVVEWDGDVAYRIGKAELDESDWIGYKKREWKKIVLG